MQSHILKRILQIGAGAAVFLLSSSASADLIGSAISCATSPTQVWACDRESAIVGSGSEFHLITADGGYIDVDFGPISLHLTWVSPNPFSFGGGEVASFGGLSLIYGIPLGGSLTGLDLSDLTISDGKLTLRFDPSTWQPGSGAVFVFLTNSAPEPDVSALLCLCVGGLLIALRVSNPNAILHRR